MLGKISQNLYASELILPSLVPLLVMPAMVLISCMANCAWYSCLLLQTLVSGLYVEIVIWMHPTMLVSAPSKVSKKYLLSAQLVSGGVAVNLKF